MSGPPPLPNPNSNPSRFNPNNPSRMLMSSYHNPAVPIHHHGGAHHHAGSRDNQLNNNNNQGRATLSFTTKRRREQQQKEKQTTNSTPPDLNQASPDTPIGFTPNSKAETSQSSISAYTPIITKSLSSTAPIAGSLTSP